MKYTQFNKLPWNEYQIPKPFQKKFSFVKYKEMMNKQMKNPYLYLETKEYAETWVSGGKIPIKLASCYRKDERSGIYTPDENIISSFPTPTRSWEWLLQKTGNAKDGGNINTIISMHPFTGEKIEMKWSDGYILSFCTIKCSKVM